MNEPLLEVFTSSDHETASLYKNSGTEKNRKETEADMSKSITERLARRRERKHVKGENSAMDVSVPISAKKERIRKQQRCLCV